MDIAQPRRLALPIAGALLIITGAALWRLDPSLDQHIFNLLKLRPDDLLAPAAAALSMFTGASGLVPLALAVAGWLIWQRRRGEALWLFLTIASGRLLIEGIKLAVERPRPPSLGRLAEVTSWSFPSSHSAGSMLTFLAFAMLFEGRRRAAVAAAIILASAVGWSRIALAVHWPSDVLAGLGFGLLYIGLAQRWLVTARLPSR